MRALDSILPTPRRLESDHVAVGASPDRVWEQLRHGELGGSPLIKALFWLRTLPERGLAGRGPALTLRIDDLRSSPERPGFQILAEQAPREFVVGAIGQVWKSKIPFMYVADAQAFAAFSAPGFIKVAWAIRLTPRGESATQVDFELRVDATDEASWKRFRRYFAVIGPASRFIRHTLLADLSRRLGTPEAREQTRALPGDALLPDAAASLTHAITIAAEPAQIWPWLTQMGCRRAGFYSIDWLDNAGARSARELHPAWIELRQGQVIPATPAGQDGFEVLQVEPGRSLILGGLYDASAGRQLPFAGARPEKFWHVTWAFVLEPVDASHTRLLVRARAALPAKASALRLHWMRFVHDRMEHAQLRHLAARIEGRMPRDDLRDVFAGIGGAAMITAALLTPFLRSRRAHWGLRSEEAERPHPGDELVGAPRWTFTHAVEIAAPASEVWPWIAQIGADRGGFYSYQWLENIAGCRLQNAEVVHPEWEVAVGGMLRLHPDMPGLRIASVQRGHYFVAYGAPDVGARQAGKPWVEASWAFVLTPSHDGCRLTSRYRVACSDDFVTRLRFGRTCVEPVSFAMDRRMLLGIQARCEQARSAATRLRNVSDLERPSEPVA